MVFYREEDIMKQSAYSVLLSVFLSVLMLIGMMPISAFATTKTAK